MRAFKLTGLMMLSLMLAGCTIEADEHGGFDFKIADLVTQVGTRSEKFEWKGRLAEGQTLEIKGVNGRIEATPASGDEIELVADKRGRRNDPAEVKIEVVEHPGGVTVCAVYPSDDPSAPNECAPGDEGRMKVRHNDVNVEFTVRVPAGVAFAGRTVNGSVDIRNLSARVDAHTVNGSVKLSTNGVAQASTVNGSVTASLGRTDWTGQVSFSTVNGSITLNLPSDLSTQIRARTTNGSITSDFDVTTQGQLSRRRLEGTIGGGGRQMELKTVNGSIRLRRGI